MKYSGWCWIHIHRQYFIDTCMKYAEWCWKYEIIWIMLDNYLHLGPTPTTTVCELCCRTWKLIDKPWQGKGIKQYVRQDKYCFESESGSQKRKRVKFDEAPISSIEVTRVSVFVYCYMKWGIVSIGDIALRWKVKEILMITMLLFNDGPVSPIEKEFIYSTWFHFPASQQSCNDL